MTSAPLQQGVKPPEAWYWLRYEVLSPTRRQRAMYSTWHWTGVSAFSEQLVSIATSGKHKTSGEKKFSKMQSGSPSISHRGWKSDHILHTQTQARTQEKTQECHTLSLQMPHSDTWQTVKNVWNCLECYPCAQMTFVCYDAHTHMDITTCLRLWHHSPAGCVYMYTCIFVILTGHRPIEVWMLLDTVAMFSTSLPFAM